MGDEPPALLGGNYNKYAGLLWEGRWCEVEALAKEGVGEGDTAALLAHAEAMFFRYALSGASEAQEEALTRLSAVSERVEELHGKSTMQWLSGKMSKVAFGSGKEGETAFAKATRKRSKLLRRALAAHADLLRGPLYLLNGRYIMAGLAFRSSLKGFESLPEHDIDPDLASYRDWGIGLFTLFLANAPPSILSLLELVTGLKGDSKEAMRLLHVCADAGGPAARWAATVLAMDKINSSAGGFDPTTMSASLTKADAIINAQRDKLPDSALLKWIHSVIYLRQGRQDEALDAMRDVHTRLEPELARKNIPPYRMALEVGAVYFAAGEFETAIDTWSALVEPGVTYTARALAATLLGAAHSANGDWNRAVELWRQVPELALTGQFDGSLCKKVQVLERRSEKGIAWYELMYVRGMLTIIRDKKRLGEMRNELEAMYERTRRLYHKKLTTVTIEGPGCGCVMEMPRGDDLVMVGDGPSTSQKPAPVAGGGRDVDELSLAEAFEQFSTVRLYLGIVYRMMGEMAEAQRHLQAVIHSVTSASGREHKLPDPFHQALGQYELAIVHMNSRAFMEAEGALKEMVAAPAGYSFESMLQYRFKAARDYVKVELNPFD